MGVLQPEGLRQIFFYSTNPSQTATRQGYRLALYNPFEIQEDLSQGRLVKLLERTVPESQGYYILTNHPEAQPLRAHLFEDWIKNVVTEDPNY